jgi:hypothetical protein
MACTHTAAMAVLNRLGGAAGGANCCGDCAGAADFRIDARNEKLCALRRLRLCDTHHQNIAFAQPE